MSELAEGIVRRVNAWEKLRMKESLRQCIQPLGGEFLLALLRYAAHLSLEKCAGFRQTGFRLRRFDCSFIFTYPVQTR